MLQGENTVTVYLPYSTDVVVKGFTNAARRQRITVQPAQQPQAVWVGAGEQNNEIGSLHFTTASGGPDPFVNVTLEYSDDGGQTWKAPDVFLDSCSVQAYQLTVVVAEDLVDEDYNDSVCMVSWPQPIASEV